MALVAAVSCLALIAAQRFIDLNLGDEGFLWYGAQRTLLGELPIRDFQAYDPGRYFWVAGWMAVLGHDAITALRWADAVLAAITVGLATWVVGTGPRRQSAGTLAVVGAIFTVWMVPHYKVSDSFATVLLLFGLTRLLQRPSLHRHLQSGVSLGLASTIGINHALYGSVAAVFALLYLRGTPHPARAVIMTVIGGVVGYAPVLILHGFAPGFTAAFLDSVLQLFESGTTNLSLPLPDLLAAVQGREKRFLPSVIETLSALLFFAVPPFWLSAAWRLRCPGSDTTVGPAVPAGLLLSVPYAHYAYSRADVIHIAVSILPLLAAVLAWTLGKAGFVQRRSALVIALGVSLAMTAREHPIYHILKGGRTEALEIDGARLLVRPDNAVEIRAVQAVVASAGPANFFIGPYMPGAYVLARRKSPTWEIYMLFPASRPRQTAEIARIKAAGVRYALISSKRVDDRPDLGINRTHPLLLAYFERCLDRSSGISAAPSLTIRWTEESKCLGPEHERRVDHAEWKSQSTANSVKDASHAF